MSSSNSPPPAPLPRVTIRFCTQCKWLLRAAYFAQELLSTFSTSLGEVALQPSTGGVFIVAIHTKTTLASTDSSNPDADADGGEQQYKVLWDRKEDGGFPETKELKRRVRDVIEPGRDLGHVDREHGKNKKGAEAKDTTTVGGEEAGKEDKVCKVEEKCEDCQ